MNIELYYNVTSITCENFRALCTGEKSNDLNKFHYKGCNFHSVVGTFKTEVGLIGTSESIYVGTFEFEIL